MRLFVGGCGVLKPALCRPPCAACLQHAGASGRPWGAAAGAACSTRWFCRWLNANRPPALTLPSSCSAAGTRPAAAVAGAASALILLLPLPLSPLSLLLCWLLNGTVSIGASAMAGSWPRPPNPPCSHWPGSPERRRAWRTQVDAVLKADPHAAATAATRPVRCNSSSAHVAFVRLCEQKQHC